MKYSIVIAYRNEVENLEQTIENIKQTQNGDIDLVCVEDSSGAGVMACRHAGIMQAKNDVIIITDAHMRFKPKAIDNMAMTIKRNGKHIYCGKCHHNATYDTSGEPYGGADMLFKCKEGDNYSTLSGKWRDNNKTGSIGCLMGAFYGFTKERYKHIGMPWSAGSGWGCDEEILTLANRFCGGDVRLINSECAHLFRTQSQVPYTLTQKDCAGVWYNRMMMIDILPLPAEVKEDLIKWLENNRQCQEHKHMIKAIYREKLNKIKQITEKLEQNKVIEWDIIKEKHVICLDKPEKDRLTILDLRKKVVKDGANWNDLKKKTRPELEKMLEEKPKRKYTANLVTTDPGIECRHCHKVHRNWTKTNTWTNGNWRGRCGLCGEHCIVRPGFERYTK
jgi:glycosyltransferase involved in cell wall biosynthesis